MVKNQRRLKTNFGLPKSRTSERQQMARLAACIQRLPDKDGLLVRWRYLKDRSVAEISDFLDEKQDAVYKRLKRALQKAGKVYER